MTTSTANPEFPRPRRSLDSELEALWAQALAWVRGHDPGLAALRRAGRAAVCMPAAFALGVKVLDNPNISIFCAFGSLALLLLAEFRGPLHDRLRAQASLALVGACFVCLGTLASFSLAVAAIAMALVGIVVIFSGVISSTLAGASIPLLLSFILPVSLGGAASEIPDRLAGWGIASGISLIAITFLWPAPVQIPLRPAAIAACRALATLLRIDGAGDPASTAGRDGARERADAATASLARLFAATPFRPAGLNTSSRVLVRLVDELRWLTGVLDRCAPAPRAGLGSTQLRSLYTAAAGVLERGGNLLSDTRASATPLADALAALEAARGDLEDEVIRHAPHRNGTDELGRSELDAFRSDLDPGFRAQELCFVTGQIAANVEAAAAAEQRTWLQSLAGRQPDGVDGVLASARARASAHLDARSVWLHNSLRGGVALGIAVLVGGLLEVEHSFWVVLGTLTILRSNALSTGQSVAHAMLGTVVGFVVGCSLIQILGANETVLWLLLPVAIVFAGFSPVAISFGAGQAAFTFALLILFNILAPAGWRIGVVRVEDIAIGGAASLLVGLLFWPRGATSALRRALADSYRQTAGYLTAAVAFATSCCDADLPPRAAPEGQAARAAAAARRLDDAFRSYVAERGVKRLGLPEATTLVNGPSALRLAGDAILDLWHGVDHRGGGRSPATRALIGGADRVDAWYEALADALEGHGRLPRPDGPRDEELLESIAPDLGEDRERATATATAVRIVWTGDHLDAARRLQTVIAGPAALAGPLDPAALRASAEPAAVGSPA